MSTPLLVLQWPATLVEQQNEEISAIEEEETWMTPLVRYLEDDIFPEDHNESRKIKKKAARGKRAGSDPRVLQSWPTLNVKVVRPRKNKTVMRHKVGMGLRKPEYAVNTT
ncbi:hypothetical protein F2Q70_00016782 [Brassica cretica]|uniref:Uncharacterized protein n=1 Tax=Brassica cretica TaxID=69181 RepID=A0A8S9HW05_BRACR|nr:hypothetical protein F2Q70_00016782 [Brassica cretica]